MEIKGTNNFLGYNSQHIQHVQREAARSVKPNVLRQLEKESDPQELLRKLLQDEVELSDEALALLKRLKKRQNGKQDFADERGREVDFSALIEHLEKMHKETHIPQEELGGIGPSQPFIPPTIELSRAAPTHRPKIRPTSSISPAGSWVDKMLVHAHTPKQRRQLIKELEVFGEDTCKYVHHFGTNIILLPPNQTLDQLTIQGMSLVGAGEKTFDGRPWSRVRGIYDSSRRILVVGSELLGHPTRSCARHEFAHAYEHAYNKKKRRRQPISVELWYAFEGQRTAMVTRYASTNPQEYFAESVEAYFTQSGKNFLAQADPLMKQYLDELFGQEG